MDALASVRQSDIGLILLTIWTRSGEGQNHLNNHLPHWNSFTSNQFWGYLFTLSFFCIDWEGQPPHTVLWFAILSRELLP